MKRIINGTRYDTETAKMIVDVESEYGISSPEYYHIKLYLKITGEFFLWTYRSFGNDIITPFSEVEAKAWVETAVNERYEEIFGEVEE